MKETNLFTNEVKNDSGEIVTKNYEQTLIHFIVNTLIQSRKTVSDELAQEMIGECFRQLSKYYTPGELALLKEYNWEFDMAFSDGRLKGDFGNKYEWLYRELDKFKSNEESESVKSPIPKKSVNIGGLV